MQPGPENKREKSIVIVVLESVQETFYFSSSCLYTSPLKQAQGPMRTACALFCPSLHVLSATISRASDQVPVLSMSASAQGRTVRNLKDSPHPALTLYYSSSKFSSCHGAVSILVLHSLIFLFIILKLFTMTYSLISLQFTISLHSLFQYHI